MNQRGKRDARQVLGKTEIATSRQKKQEMQNKGIERGKLRFLLRGEKGDNKV